jgi:DNA-3-methyladenine glycosylase II
VRASNSAFEIELPGPIDFAASLEIFRRSGDDLLDRWDGKWLRRTTRIGGRARAYACEIAGTLDAPRLRVQLESPADRAAVEHVIARAFLPLGDAFADLCGRDPLIAKLAQIHRGFRPVLQADLLGALIRCISAQQVNLKWAATTRRRLAETFGDAHRIGEEPVYSLDPERLAALQIADIRALQFTTRKAEYVINAARAIASGELDIERLEAMPDDEVIARITAIRGLGVWTAEWILARAMGRPRISAADLGVRKAIAAAYLGGRMPSPDEVRAATAHWGDAAALAQGLLLHAQHEKTLAAIADAPISQAPMTRTGVSGVRQRPAS